MTITTCPTTAHIHKHTLFLSPTHPHTHIVHTLTQQHIKQTNWLCLKWHCNFICACCLKSRHSFAANVPSLFHNVWWGMFVFNIKTQISLSHQLTTRGGLLHVHTTTHPSPQSLSTWISTTEAPCCPRNPVIPPLMRGNPLTGELEASAI